MQIPQLAEPPGEARAARQLLGEPLDVPCVEPGTEAVVESAATLHDCCDQGGEARRIVWHRRRGNEVGPKRGRHVADVGLGVDDQHPRFVGRDRPGERVGQLRCTRRPRQVEIGAPGHQHLRRLEGVDDRVGEWGEGVDRPLVVEDLEPGPTEVITESLHARAVGAVSHTVVVGVIAPRMAQEHVMASRHADIPTRFGRASGSV